MKIASHLDKFHRLDATLQRLDPVVDCELWIWTAMNAGVHLLNAALHASELTRETDSFHTQVEGVYTVIDRTNGTMHDAMHPPGDVMHVGQPKIDAPLPADLARACAALRTIEDLREPFVRGGERVDAGAASKWREAYRTCVSALQTSLRAGGRHG